VSVIIAVRAVLITDTAVKALLVARVYPKMLPQAVTYPAATLELITDDPQNTLSAPGTLKWARVRVNAWGLTYAAAEGLAKKIETALNFKKGSFAGTEIRSVDPQGLRDFYEPAVEAYYHSQDFAIYYK
jgi:hypothetical protein